MRPVTSVQTTFNGTRTVGYGYDNANNRTSVTYPDAKVASYIYDANNRMSTVSASWLSGVTTYTYDGAGRPTSTALPASTGIGTTYGYDNADRLTSVTNVKAGAPPTTLSFFNYVVNPNGNRTQVTDNTGVSTYAYDNLDRLTSVTYPGPTTTAYTYDGVGNRLTMQVDANPATTYTYDQVDRRVGVHARIPASAVLESEPGDQFFLGVNVTCVQLNALPCSIGPGTPGAFGVTAAFIRLPIPRRL